VGFLGELEDRRRRLRHDNESPPALLQEEGLTALCCWQPLSGFEPLTVRSQEVPSDREMTPASPDNQPVYLHKLL
jgi:hypothetical protein